MSNNLIPSINLAGSFEALAPFDKVVSPTKFYTVEAIRTIQEMEGLKLNLFDLVFEPVGLLEEDFPTVLTRAKEEGSVIVTLLDRSGVPTYVPTTYIKSFPKADGYVYERMCLLVDLGPCPPALANTIAQAQQHIREYVLNTVGIDKEVKLGTIPTKGYTSLQQHNAFEEARRLLVKEVTNDVAKVRYLEEQLLKKDLYIAKLEERLLPL